MAREQERFLDAVDRDTAERRWWQWLRPQVLGAEELPLAQAIAPVTATYGLGLLPCQVEQYDFAIPEDRWDRPAVRAFRALFEQTEVAAALAALGFPESRAEN